MTNPYPTTSSQLMTRRDYWCVLLQLAHPPLPSAKLLAAARALPHTPNKTKAP